MKLPTENNLIRFMAFTEETPECYGRLADDVAAALWMEHEHLIGENARHPRGEFRWDLRARWESMFPARRSMLRRKTVPWLRELYVMALHRSTK